MTPSEDPRTGAGSTALEAPPPGEDGSKPRRTFNEAAHKLGQWTVVTQPVPKKTEGPQLPHDDDHRDVIAHAGKLVLALGALGVVYGDIGTSPLYSVQVAFAHASGGYAATRVIDPAAVYGVLSLMFWSLMIVVSTKYAGFIMRAHNRGDGGIMALTALVQRRKVPRAAILAVLGIFGAGLFFGDGMITPAISVISSVEGLETVSSSFRHLVVPLAVVILLGLFVVQRHGTGAVGWMFGPVILLFFAVIGGFGLGQIVQHPGVLQCLSPSWAVRFMIDHGGEGFLILGAVVLVVTGSEAMYADRGHFGAGPIRWTWFTITFPAVMLSYMGQGAWVLAHSSLADSAYFNPFFDVVPSGLRLPMILLATLATIIASQAAITGSFSVARQAVQLGFLPRLKILHTSATEGQIYVPLINWMLAAGVITLVLVFQASAKLTDIYGVAVTATFILNTILFVAVSRSLWKTPRWQLAVLAGIFLTVETAFFTSNIAKVEHGAWLSLAVGLVYAFVMLTWRRGREIVTENRINSEGALSEFLESLPRAHPLKRVPGTAIFLNPGRHTTPLALRAEVERIHALHEKVIIVSLDQVSVPHVDPDHRFSTDFLGQGLYKVIFVTIRVGYRERTNVPKALAEARKAGFLERALDLEHASYIVSRMTIVPTDAPGMDRWRKRLFVAMARNSTSPIDQFGLPSERTVMMGSQVSV